MRREKEKKTHQKETGQRKEEKTRGKKGSRKISWASQRNLSQGERNGNWESSRERNIKRRKVLEAKSCGQAWFKEKCGLLGLQICGLLPSVLYTATLKLFSSGSHLASSTVHVFGCVSLAPCELRETNRNEILTSINCYQLQGRSLPTCNITSGNML